MKQFSITKTLIIMTVLNIILVFMVVFIAVFAAPYTELEELQEFLRV